MRNVVATACAVFGGVCCLGAEFAIPETEGFDEAAARVAEFRRRNPDYDKPVVVTFKPGVRYLSRPIVLDWSVAGTRRSPTVFRAEPNADVVFSGGVRLTNWIVRADGVWEHPIDASGLQREYFTPILALRKTYENPAHGRFERFTDPHAMPEYDWSVERALPSRSVNAMTQFFVNDQRRFRPRYPENGFLTVADHYDAPKGSWPGGKQLDCRFKFRATDAIPTAFRNRSDVDVVCYHIQSQSRIPLGEIDYTNRVINVRGWTADSWGHYKKGYPWYFDNVAETFRQPGQWYFDRGQAKLLYRPLPGETPENCVCVLPRLTRMLMVRSTRHVVFENLQFAHSAWKTPFPMNPQGELFSCSAAYLWGCQHCRLTDCCFRNLGSYALNITKWSEDNAIEGCEFFDIGAGGIKIIGNRNKIAECDIGYFGRTQPGGTGVFVHIASNNQIVDNDIHHGYYMGVNVGYRFGYYHPTAAYDNYVARNHVHHLGEYLLADQGGVYVVGTNPGTIVEDNLIHDINARLYGGWGLYTDEGCTGVVMRRNIVHDTNHASFHQHFGQDNLIENNIFAFTKGDQGNRMIAKTRGDQPHSFRFRKNIVCWQGDGRVFSGRWDDDHFAIDDNWYFCQTNAVSFPKDWQKRGHDLRSVVNEDPGFVDADRRDFRFRADAPVFARIGFERLRVERPGRHRPLVFRNRFPKVPEPYPVVKKGCGR